MPVYLVILMLSGGNVDIMEISDRESFAVCHDTIANAPPEIKPSLRCTSDVHRLIGEIEPKDAINAAARAWNYKGVGLLTQCAQKQNTKLTHENGAALYEMCD